MSWPEPEFKDNVKVEKVIHNINNNEVLPAQVYFVYYAAKDTYGNEATCRFFVHVRGELRSHTCRTQLRPCIFLKKRISCHL